MDDPLLDDPRVRQALDLFAREARVDPSTLDLDRRIDELGIASLDMALALFELEDRCGIALPEPPNSEKAATSAAAASPPPIVHLPRRLICFFSLATGGDV